MVIFQKESIFLDLYIVCAKADKKTVYLGGLLFISSEI